MKYLLFFYRLTYIILFVLVFSCKAPDKGYDLYIFNSLTEKNQEFEELCRAYTAETGVRIKVLIPGIGRDNMEILENELNSLSRPVIFTIRDIKELMHWKEAGFVQDLNHAADDTFLELISGLAPALQLNAGGISSFGIPASVEAFGFIVNRDMLSSLFGEGNEENVLADIKTASWDEWAVFIQTLDRWIQFPFPYRIILSGRLYTFLPLKTGPALNLDGVFNLRGMDNLINAALNAAFVSPYMAYRNVLDETDNFDYDHILSPVFFDFARALDLLSSFRTENESINSFTNSNVVFIIQNNQIYQNIAEQNAAMAGRLEMLPLKIPFRNSSIVRGDGITAELLNRSIPVFAKGYYAVNNLSSQEEKKLAYDFLLWLYSSSQTIPNVLEKSIDSYIQSGNIIAASSCGVPGTWPGNIVRTIMEEFLTRESWTTADYPVIAEYALNQWLKLNAEFINAVP